MLLVIIVVFFILDMLVCGLYCTIRNKKRMSKESIIDYFLQDTFKGHQNIIDCDILYEKLFSAVKRNTFLKKCTKVADSIVRLSVKLVGFIPSHFIRLVIYKFVFRIHIGKNVVIYYGAEIRSPWNLYIGDGTIIGDKAILDCRSGLCIGENVNLSTGVWIWTLQHGINENDFSTKNEIKPVFVENRAWLSCRTTILPGVKICEGSVVAAGAVVSKSTEPFSLYGGVPAKYISRRNNDINYVFDGSHMLFI